MWALNQPTHLGQLAAYNCYPLGQLKYGMKDTKDWDIDTKPLADLPNQLGSMVTGKGV